MYSANNMKAITTKGIVKIEKGNENNGMKRRFFIKVTYENDREELLDKLTQEEQTRGFIELKNM